MQFYGMVSISEYRLLFTHHYPARCFGMNMPKSRDIRAKIPLPQAIWNEFWLRYCEQSENSDVMMNEKVIQAE